MRIQALAYELPLRHVFTISRGSLTTQPTFIVELTQDGMSGYGEATTNDYYGVTLERLANSVKAAQPLIEAQQMSAPESLWQQLEPVLGDNPFAQCAVDQAAWDLWGKLQGKPLYALWNLDPQRAPPTDYTIGIDTIDKMVEKMREFPTWPVYKIKLGTDHDVDIVRRLRAETTARFRVDANCAWTARQTIDNARQLQPLNVEFIEQPLPAEDWHAMRDAYQHSVLPLVADESCIVSADVDRCHGFFHGINIKLVKCGGITPARRMIQRARELGLQVMIGCMTESSIGISAIAHLAPLLDYVNMDGTLLLAEDIAEGVTIEDGICHYPARNGTGVQLTRTGHYLVSSR